MSTEAFADVLCAKEKILVSLGAPRESPEGDSLGWAHIALTEDRVLLAEIARDPRTKEIRVGTRVALPRDGATLERYARTEGGPARLVIRGFAEPVILVDLDRPELFAQLYPFLAAWPGTVGGSGPIRLRFDPALDSEARPLRLTRVPGLLLGLAMGTVLGLFILWSWG
jgi:hypothetical protein